MSRYLVEWTEEALDELAMIWENAINRRSVTQSQHEVDRHLSSTPIPGSSDISEGLRKLEVLPLVVYLKSMKKGCR